MTARHASSALLFDGPGEPVSLFPSLKRENGAPGGARRLARPPHGQTLAIGFARAPFGSGVMSPAPGAPPSLRSEGAAPPGAPFGRAHTRLAAVHGMSPHAPLRRRPSPLE